jgi:magnesium chelatase subunit I
MNHLPKTFQNPAVELQALPGQTLVERRPPTFPFAAIVGQDEMKRAILLTAVDPTIGGVLVLGDRGTGKSTAVRGLAELLPEIEEVADCPCHCAPEKRSSGCLPACRERSNSAVTRAPVPVVDLPLGATEDRIVGAMNLERALVDGERVFEPGLLAAANRGFLYIDEINLLEDHLVDLLLDAAASGENVVEREGLSVRHPAKFVLVGSGNPEEGDLRPQLLDRFGLSVEITTPRDIKQRVEIVRRRDEFERDPSGFVHKWRPANGAIRDTILSARQALPEITMPGEILEKATELCLNLGTDGLRGEMAIVKAARAAAALDGSAAVSLAHVSSVAPSALRHRLRRDPLDETGTTARVARAMSETLGTS